MSTKPLKAVAVTYVLAFFITASGCEADRGLGRVDGMWGPGVVEVDIARQKIRRLAEEAYDEAYAGQWERRQSEVTGILHALTWRQATYVYRTSGTKVRTMLSEPLLQGNYEKFPPGMTKDAIIRLLGKPDDDWGHCLVYTGQDSASDSHAPGLLFNLDENRRLTHISCGP